MVITPTYLVRVAVSNDLDAILELEQLCFDESRQSDRRSLKKSLSSDRQLCYVLIEQDQEIEQERIIGVVICFLYKLTVRIYSIALHPHARGQGLGLQMLNTVRDKAQNLGFKQLSLEVSLADQKRVSWYTQYGFEPQETLVDYYNLGEDGLRMRYKIKDPRLNQELRTLIVTYHPHLWDFESIQVQAITPRIYLSDSTWLNREGLRVINLCAPYRDQSLGYYASLLAVARNHRVIPNVIMINDLSAPRLTELLPYELEQQLQRKLGHINSDRIEMIVLFETCAESRLRSVAQIIARYIEVPLFKVKLERESRRPALEQQATNAWHIRRVEPLTLAQALRLDPETLKRAVPNYFNRRRFQHPKLKNYRYDLAILVDPNEATPPSCPIALEQFCVAAEKVGFYVELITAKEAHRIAEFDALFIRETTRVKHHSYQISRLANTEGLVVIDDPWSILKCSNKVYLYETLSRAGLKQPKSWVFTVGIPLRLEELKLNFPLVLKHPEGSFSKGVFKVDSLFELRSSLERLFKETDLVIGQEFLQSDFDWRIGVFNHQVIFACKYYMAQGHWQIYNWSSEDQNEMAGRSETLSTQDVPKFIVEAALKSAHLIGDGLYGVDLKEVAGEAYIIEVNDNPNIDAGIEDAVAGESLYLGLMSSLMERIERERGHLNTMVTKQVSHKSVKPTAIS